VKIQMPSPPLFSGMSDVLCAYDSVPGTVQYLSQMQSRNLRTGTRVSWTHRNVRCRPQTSNVKYCRSAGMLAW
jgi:hypothetical protein